MKRAETGVALALALAMALMLGACALTGKPKTAAAAPPAPQPVAVTPKPAPPPQPLSVPQTQVRLPPPQPVNPEALNEVTKPEEAAPAAAAPRAPRRAAPPPKPETTGPPAPPTNANAQPEAPAPVAPVQEVLSDEDRRRFQESIANRKTEIQQLLAQLHGHRLSADENRDVRRIQSYLGQSDEAAKKGEMRQADALAERALVLAREVTGAK